MIKEIRYTLARLLVWLLAVQTLNISIDIDHLTAHSIYETTEYRDFDDIDSFSEILSEFVTNDPNACPEKPGEDHLPGHKLMHKRAPVLVCSRECCSAKILTNYQQSSSIKPVLLDIQFLQEDFSSLHCPPPDMVPYQA